MRPDARLLVGAAVLTLTLSQIGCGAKRNTGLREAPATVAAAPTEASAMDAAEALWVQREDPARLREAIAAFEKILETEPSNRAAAVRLARGTYFLADAYIDDPAEKLAMYEKATYYGERAMALNPAFKAKIDQGLAPKDALDTLGKEDAEAIYWTASALGKWAKAQGFSTVLKNKSTIYGFVSRVTELAPELYYNGPARYWGSYYAVAPSFAGGDINKSKEWFDKAIAGSPSFLGTKVLMAENYATKAQDKALFEKLLQEVIDADPNAIPDVVAEQKVEQRKAKDLLNRKNDLFVE